MVLHQDRRSTSEYLFQVAGGPVSWKKNFLKSVCCLITEVEYYSTLLCSSRDNLNLMNSLQNLEANQDQQFLTNMLLLWPNLPIPHLYQIFICCGKLIGSLIISCWLIWLMTKR